MAALTREETEALIQEVLEVYPEQARKDRAKHLRLTINPWKNQTNALLQTVNPSRHNDHSWLCLRRFQRGGLGSD